MIHEALGLTPLTKILYSSDAFSIPEIFWLANRWAAPRWSGCSARSSRPAR